MKRASIIFVAFAVLAGMHPTGARADGVVLDRAAVEALLGASATVESFERLPELAPYYYYGITAPQPLDEATVIPPLGGLLPHSSGPGLIVPGVRFWGMDAEWMYVIGGNVLGIPSRSIYFLTFIHPRASLEIDFETSTPAFGVDLRELVGRQAAVDATIFAPDDVTVLDHLHSFPVPGSAFLGYAAAGGIGKVVIQHSPEYGAMSYYTPIIDNLVFAPTPPDTTPPIFTSIPLGITTEADREGGALVTWPQVTATDDDGQPPILAGSHEPGAFFPLGTTNVTYTATDGAGNVATQVFPVTVVDTSPPVLADPNDTTYDFILTGKEGAFQTFEVDLEVSDLCDPAPQSRVVGIAAEGVPTDPGTINWIIPGGPRFSLRMVRGARYEIDVGSRDASGNESTKHIIIHFFGGGAADFMAPSNPPEVRPAQPVLRLPNQHSDEIGVRG